jgi:hypothetical protein
MSKWAINKTHEILGLLSQSEMPVKVAAALDSAREEVARVAHYVISNHVGREWPTADYVVDRVLEKLESK